MGRKRPSVRSILTASKYKKRPGPRPKPDPRGKEKDYRRQLDAMTEEKVHREIENICLKQSNTRLQLSISQIQASLETLKEAHLRELRERRALEERHRQIQNENICTMGFSSFF